MKKQQKSVKIKNFQKRSKTFLGIAILKLHTKFHWATTNSFWVMRDRSFPEEKKEEEKKTKKKNPAIGSILAILTKS